MNLITDRYPTAQDADKNREVMVYDSPETYIPLPIRCARGSYGWRRITKLDLKDNRAGR